MLLRRGDDSPIHVPHERIDSGWSARAVLREYPTGPDVQVWSTGDGSAVVEQGQVVLLCDELGDAPWTVGEITINLTAPDGTRVVTDPIRARLR